MATFSKPRELFRLPGKRKQPLAEADRNGAVALVLENAGYKLGTTRTCQRPPGPYASRAGGVDSSWPGQNGQGRVGSASTAIRSP